MPNLPAAIGKGATAIYGEALDASLRARAEALVAPLGLVEWIDREGLFDAVTALSGSGPAFVFRFIEAMAEGGAALGLPRAQADRLALATVEGAALLAAGAKDDAAMLAERVASPGGTTREGLNVLDADRALKRLVAATLAAAARRSAEMAAAARG
jgi:pyrroline-5-carboxylate reductase